MDDNKAYLYIEDVDDIDEDFLEDEMYWFCGELFKRIRPDEEVPDRSVCVGKLYKSKYSYSCQIRYSKNGIIFKCKYLINKGIFEVEIYELTHVKHGIRVVNNESDTLKDHDFYMEYKDYIDDVKEDNLEFLRKQKEKKKKKEESKSRSMKRTRPKEEIK